MRDGSEPWLYPGASQLSLGSCKGEFTRKRNLFYVRMISHFLQAKYFLFGEKALKAIPRVDAFFSGERVSLSAVVIESMTWGFVNQVRWD